MRTATHPGLHLAHLGHLEEEGFLGDVHPEFLVSRRAHAGAQVLQCEWTSSLDAAKLFWCTSTLTSGFVWSRLVLGSSARLRPPELLHHKIHALELTATPAPGLRHLKIRNPARPLPLPPLHRQTLSPVKRLAISTPGGNCMPPSSHMLSSTPLSQVQRPTSNCQFSTRLFTLKPAEIFPIIFLGVPIHLLPPICVDLLPLWIKSPFTASHATIQNLTVSPASLFVGHLVF
ncbi:hypothetical protein F5882DRAFT_377696 [Hyaloscypha sp. PMI_1271]|nr:hypothetical protein F5882DRAFT_377696 [Hyaloscypha sp. PMI_1271]